MEMVQTQPTFASGSMLLCRSCFESRSVCRERRFLIGWFLCAGVGGREDAEGDGHQGHGRRALHVHGDQRGGTDGENFQTRRAR